MKLKRTSIFTRIVIAALIVYAAVMLVNIRSRIAAAEADRAALEAEAETLRRENLVLSYDIEHADDPEVVAEIARGKLGLVRPGEKVFYDIGN